MTNKYEPAFLDSKISFRFNGWLQIRRDNIDCTHIAWVKNNKMHIDELSIYNSKTAILVFLN